MSTQIAKWKTAAEILTTDYPEPRWIVPGILPEGFTLLAGKAKLGKSWLALQIAQAVGTGGMVFDERVEPRRVLFLALEDGERRLKDRMKAQGWPTVETVVFRTSCEPTELEGLIRESQAELTFIDTASRMFGIDDQNDVAKVTKALGPLQRLTQDMGIAAVVLDHHSKAGSGDPVGDILGSTGKGAVADTIMGLYRERGQRGATLSVVGRDVEDETLQLEWDQRFCCWQLTHDAGGGKHDGAILEALLSGPAGPSEVARRTGINKGNVHRALVKLAQAGRVEHDAATNAYRAA